MPNPTSRCLICDQEWIINESRENKNIYCLDCRRTERQIDYGLADPCIPWRGEFDLDDNPMLGNKLYMTGERICKHKDCVQQSHLSANQRDWRDLEAERLGAKSWSELMNTLKREKTEMSQDMDRIQKTA
jgi:hypothetical protein